MDNIGHNLPLEKLLNVADENIANLRKRLKNKADKILPEIPEIGTPISGNIYVESVGSIIEFDEYGNHEFVYTPESLSLRNRSLLESEKAREKVFYDIAKLFPDHSRILNVGAGGDVTLPDCMEKSGHEIISTDLSQNTIDTLNKQIHSPVFACDLFYINEILPDDCIDIVLGNSTLGYVDPEKLQKVIRNLSCLMKKGGIFTFDLTPHPIYFQAQDPKQKQTVVNESDIDPTKLIEFIEKYGVLNGINAMAYFSYYRGIYTNIAVLFLIKELFENEGLSCVASTQQLLLENKSFSTQISLRVSKGYHQILNMVENENELNEKTFLDMADEKKIWYRLALIDRHNGELLAKKFGIHTNKKEDPWNVALFINENLSPNDLSPEIKEEVLQEIDPWKLANKIRPFLYGQNIPKQEPLPLEIIVDQTMHKMVLTRTIELSPEEADLRIDNVYKKVALKKQFKEQRNLHFKKKQVSKSKRKQAKKSRKKNR